MKHNSKYRNTQYKRSTSSPFYWVYVLFLFWLPVPLLHSSLFSGEIKRSEYLSIITAHTVFLLVKASKLQVLAHVSSYFWMMPHVLFAFWLLYALILFPICISPDSVDISSQLWVMSTAKRRCLSFPSCVPASKYPERAAWCLNYLL